MEKLLTPEEAAELLRFSVYTLQDYARKGIIPAIKVGRTWRFSEPELTAWLAKQHTGPSYAGTPSGGHGVARDRPSKEPETAQDRFVRQMIAEREAAWRDLQEWKKNIKPFDVQRLLDEADQERDERYDRLFGKKKEE